MRTQSKAAAAVGSGLGAIRLALLALRVETGSEVIVPAYSCVALANAVLAVGATPVCADIEVDSWTLSPDDVQTEVNETDESHNCRSLVRVSGGYEKIDRLWRSCD